MSQFILGQISHTTLNCYILYWYEHTLLPLIIYTMCMIVSTISMCMTVRSMHSSCDFSLQTIELEFQSHEVAEY